jgi:hypothetical protein
MISLAAICALQVSMNACMHAFLGGLFTHGLLQLSTELSDMFELVPMTSDVSTTVVLAIGLDVVGAFVLDRLAMLLSPLPSAAALST